MSGDALLLIDTDRIKGFVFATPYLRDIRGGSALLDRLNREDPQGSDAGGGEPARVDPAAAGAPANAVDLTPVPTLVARLAPGSECIYANGGTALFALSEACVKRVIPEVSRAYAAVGASATSVWVSLPEGWTQETDLGPQLRLLAHRLRVAKDERPTHTVLASSPFLRPCEACGVEYSRNRLKRDRRQQRLCPACLARRDSARDATWASDLRNEMGADLARLPPPDDFEEIAETSSPSGYIGLIYADGNGMGQRVSKIGRLTHLQNFASIVDTSLKAAVGRALQSHLRPEPRKGESPSETGQPPEGEAPSAGDDSRKPRRPFEVLMLGGDDLVMVTRAQSALDVALATVEEFERLTGEKFKSHGYAGEEWAKPVSLSAAVVISHSHFPFGSLLHLAETALKAAKRDGARAAAQVASPPARINFLVVSSASHVDFDDYREDQLELKLEPERAGEKRREFVLTARPYSPTGLNGLLTVTRKLAALPHSRIQQFREACYMKPLRGQVEALATLARMKEKDRALVWEAVTETMGRCDRREFPWFPAGSGSDDKRRTPFVDIAELMPFVKPQEVGERDGR